MEQTTDLLKPKVSTPTETFHMEQLTEQFFFLTKTMNLSFQDSSSGNTSDGDSQDGGVPSKGKAKDRKDNTPRALQHKSHPGYKVEEKSP